MGFYVFFYSSDTASFSNFELTCTVLAGKPWCPYLKNITPLPLISYKQPPMLEANLWG